MQTPIQVTFRHLKYSPSIANTVRKKAKLLEKFYSRITSMRIVIEPTAKRQHHGNLYHIRLDMTVPGKEIVVGRDPKLRQQHQDIYVAIRDTFHAAKRQLMDYVSDKFREKRRPRNERALGNVTPLFEDRGYGG